MTTAAIKFFDTHEFIKQSKEFGSSEALAKYQVKQFEQAIEIAVSNVKDDIKSKEIFTKRDIRESELRPQKKIINSRNQMILWIVRLILANSCIEHFLK